MEHPFFPTTTTRAEALRWLTIAEKLLSARDLMGSKSFATRARDSDPTLTPADQILSVADTLLAGDRRIGPSNHPDWYAVLRLTPHQGRDAELVAAQYRSLAVALNPQKNKFAFAEQAFRLVVDAWATLSNPTRKSMYDKEIGFFLQPQQQQHQTDPFNSPNSTMQQNFMFFGGGGSSGTSSGVTNPHFSQSQVHANPQQNFMNFTSGSNLVFGSASGSGSKSIHESVNFTTTTTTTTTTTPPPPVATQGQVNNNNNSNSQTQQNYSNVGDKTATAAPNVHVRENVGERTENHEENGERVDASENYNGPTFWTACPYCYYMYEYPKVYGDCTMRCQNCKKAFQAVVISSPPPVIDGHEGYFCCWGFLPLGFSMENWEKNKGAKSTWSPFSPMFTCPQPFNGSNNAAKRATRKSSGPRVYIDDDEVFVEISDSSESDDIDWQKDTEKRKKKVKSVKAKGASGGTPGRAAKKAQVDKGKNVNVVQDGFVAQTVEETANKVAAESSKKGAAVNARKQPGRVAKNFGKLDLNVEFSNEPEEPAPKVNQENGPSRGEDENIEGMFFEGLDEFLSSLPILNVVGDDKVVKAA